MQLRFKYNKGSNQGFWNNTTWFQKIQHQSDRFLLPYPHFYTKRQPQKKNLKSAGLHRMSSL